MQDCMDFIHFRGIHICHVVYVTAPDFIMIIALSSEVNFYTLESDVSLFSYR